MWGSAFTSPSSAQPCIHVSLPSCRIVHITSDIHVTNLLSLRLTVFRHNITPVQPCFRNPVTARLHNTTDQPLADQEQGLFMSCIDWYTTSTGRRYCISMHPLLVLTVCKPIRNTSDVWSARPPVQVHISSSPSLSQLPHPEPSTPARPRSNDKCRRSALVVAV